MNGLVSAVGPLVASIPSPSQHTWYLGPFPLRAYALAILAGIAVAVWLTRKRWAERGGDPDDVLEIAFWAVPFGIVGGRLYHVISTPDPYFGGRTATRSRRCGSGREASGSGGPSRSAR